MSRKGAELFTETKELIITLSEPAQDKAELSRMLNIPRTTITSVLIKYRRTGTVETLFKSNRRLTLQDKAKRVQNKDFQPENRTKGVAFGRIIIKEG